MTRRSVVEDLAEQLRGLDVDYRAAASTVLWPAYYGDWFLSRQTLLATGPTTSGD